jgi:hypothetical protein
VGGVGKQRERVGEDPDDYLDRHEREDQSKCDGQRSLVRIGADGVAVASVPSRTS